jgi:hypothetical protein
MAWRDPATAGRVACQSSRPARGRVVEVYGGDALSQTQAAGYAA